jgi:hypothetical protein
LDAKVIVPENKDTVNMPRYGEGEGCGLLLLVYPYAGTFTFFRNFLSYLPVVFLLFLPAFMILFTPSSEAVS